jgi:hypothetical protein
MLLELKPKEQPAITDAHTPALQSPSDNATQ